jgi:hypothetical protein
LVVGKGVKYALARKRFNSSTGTSCGGSLEGDWVLGLEIGKYGGTWLGSGRRLR